MRSRVESDTVAGPSPLLYSIHVSRPAGGRAFTLCTIPLALSLSLSVGLLWFVPLWILPRMVRASVPGQRDLLPAGRWREPAKAKAERKSTGESRRRRIVLIRKIRKKISGRGTRAPRTPQAFFIFLTTRQSPARQAGTQSKKPSSGNYYGISTDACVRGR